MNNFEESVFKTRILLKVVIILLIVFSIIYIRIRNKQKNKELIETYKLTENIIYENKK